MKRSTCLLVLNPKGRNRSASGFAQPISQPPVGALVTKTMARWQDLDLIRLISLAIVCLLAIAIVCIAPSQVNGQSGSTLLDSTLDVRTQATAELSTDHSASAELTRTVSPENENEIEVTPEIRKLLEVQAKVQKAAAKNMESTVAITDGIGFGTGVIVNESGLILTAGHVMTTGGNNWKVIFPSGKQVSCRPLGKNLNVDAGMVRITEPGPWPAVEMSRKKPELGDWVVSLGHSGGFELGRNPPIRTGKFISVRQNQMVTDAVLIGGDSGGPLFNLDGQLIGIHSSIGENVAENRHVPLSTFVRDWKDLLAGRTWGSLPELDAPSDALRKTRRGKLGITMDRSATNALIKAVAADSPAGKLGVRVGDVVVELDGIQITSSGQLIDLIKKKRATEKCSLLVIRNGGYFRYDVELMASRE